LPHCATCAQVSEELNADDCDCGDAHAAVAAGHCGCLRYLLATNPDSVNVLNEHHQTLLHAVQHSSDTVLCHDITEVLVAAAANEQLMNAFDDSGQTPLQRTVWTTAATDADAFIVHSHDSVTRHMCMTCAKTLLYSGSTLHTAELAEHFVALAATELYRFSASMSDCTIVVTLLQQCCAELDLNKCLRTAVLQPLPEAYQQIPLLLQCGADTAAAAVRRRHCAARRAGAHTAAPGKRWSLLANDCY
jgi:hypothetical protein